MSTSSVGSSTSATSSSQYSTGDQLTSLGTGSPLQVTGLASGLDTNAIVNALMATQQQQVTNLTNQQTGLTSMNTQLTTIQTALQKVAADAQALGNPSLFGLTQTINSTNPTLVGATATSSNGAVVGGYQVSVSALASASQKTYSFTSQSSADTVTIDGQQISLAAGATADDLVNAVNSNSNLDVWATVTQEASGNTPATVVFSDRQTGAPSGNYIQVSDTAGALTDTGNDVPGTDAQYTINGGATQYSSSNTISGASLGGTTPPTQGQGATQTIPGVSLSLNGVTGSTPVTVTVGTPAPSTQNITTAVQQFITDYNSAIKTIQTQLTQAPSSSDPTQGTLFGDPDLQQLLSTMRDQMDATVGGLTGQRLEHARRRRQHRRGVRNGGALAERDQRRPDARHDCPDPGAHEQREPRSSRCSRAGRSASRAWSTTRPASPGGTIDNRISGDDTQINYLATQISNMQANNTAACRASSSSSSRRWRRRSRRASRRAAG